jgi:translation initiation factor 1 (eIF-1/SUI1)
VEKERRICLARESRGKKKYTTVVTGLASYGTHCYGYIVKFLQLIGVAYYYNCFLGIVDIDLKAASKFFASRFSCGSSVTGEDEIVIQGDFKDDLFDILPEKWSEVRIRTTIVVINGRILRIFM